VLTSRKRDAELVPAGFDAYAQVLHPASGPGTTQVLWTEAAESVGRPLLPGVWFQDLEEVADADDQRTRSWAQAPQLGEIPDDVLDVLRPILACHAASEHGWFCLWDGWGTFTGSMTLMVGWPADNPPPPGTPSQFRARPAFPPEIGDGPKVTLRNREYLLFEGPLVSARHRAYGGPTITPGAPPTTSTPASPVLPEAEL
jgi:hypothetical protein